MTTATPRINFALSKFYCRDVLHEQRFGTIILCTPMPNPLIRANFTSIVISPPLIKDTHRIADLHCAIRQT